MTRQRRHVAVGGVKLEHQLCIGHAVVERVDSVGGERVVGERPERIIATRIADGAVVGTRPGGHGGAPRVGGTADARPHQALGGRARGLVAMKVAVLDGGPEVPAYVGGHRRVGIGGCRREHGPRRGTVSGGRPLPADDGDAAVGVAQRGLHRMARVQSACAEAHRPRVVGVGDGHSHLDSVGAALAISQAPVAGLHRELVGAVAIGVGRVLVVERPVEAQHAVARADGEPAVVAAADQPPCDGVTVGVGGVEVVQRGVGGAVEGLQPSRRRVGDHRRIHIPGVARGCAGGPRPGAVAHAVHGPHLHLVGGVGRQAVDGPRRGGAVGCVGRLPGPARTARLPVAHVVVDDGRTVAVGRGPGDRQARQ